MKLRLVATETPVDDPFGREDGHRRAPGRPSDVPDPWHISPSSGLRSVADQARQAALHLDTALALVIERELLRGEFNAVGLPTSTLTDLDCIAAEARVDQPLGGADAVYLRSLTRGATVVEPLTPSIAGTSVCVSLPARLSSRLLRAGGIERFTLDEPLAAAVRAEIAALCCGRSMSEWAAQVVLRRQLGSDSLLTGRSERGPTSSQCAHT